MSYANLRQFIEALDAAGQLCRVSRPVSPLLEAAHLADRMAKRPTPSISPTARQTDANHHHLGGKALLFEQVEGAKFPLAMNLFGSYRRMEMALGCQDGGFEALAQAIGQIARPQPPATLMDKLRKGLEFARIASYAPKVVRSGPAQQVIKTAEQVDLFELPIIKCWPNDGDPGSVGFANLSPNQGEGRFITLGQMYTIAPSDAGVEGPRPSRNIGMYRAQVLDRNRTAMHWHMHHDGAAHWRAWKRLGRPMPLAIAFGGPSVLAYAATAPMPPGISELLLAGLLNRGSIELLACRTIDLHVPAESEIVIEGLISTEARPPGLDRVTATADQVDNEHDVLEGPFGDHTGFYSLPDRYPVFTVTAITHRRDPIYPATVVGQPPMEDYFMGKATERIFLPLLQTLIPDIVDYDLPMFGAFHNCVFVKIRKAYPLHARRVMHAIWGAGQMAWTKMIVVVDDAVDVHDHEQVLFHLCANCDMARDVELSQGPLDILDHAAPQMGAGAKIGFDATRKIAGEQVGGHAVRDYPPLLAMTEAVRRKVDAFFETEG